MPPLEYADHYDTVVCWFASGIDQYGRNTVSQPKELEGRWEFAIREILSNDGAKVLAEVTLHVSQEIPIGTIVWKGSLSELPTDEADITDLYEVFVREEVSSLKGKY